MRYYLLQGGKSTYLVGQAVLLALAWFKFEWDIELEEMFCCTNLLSTTTVEDIFKCIISNIFQEDNLKNKDTNFT